MTEVVTPAAVLNEQQPLAEITKNITADNVPIPLVYGQAQLGGKPFAVDYSNDQWTVGYLLCLGEIEAVDSVLINGEAPDAAVTINSYTGTTSQLADPLLAAAITDYDDTLVITSPDGDMGVAYVVLQYPGSLFDSWPYIVVNVRGKKVWNPKTSTTIYSDNPALHLGDLIRSPIYGQNLTVDDTALEAAQDANDDTSAGEVRRESYTVIYNARRTHEWVDTLRAYAGCWVVNRANTVYLVPDRPGSSIKTITASDMVQGSFSIKKKDSSNMPTVIRVYYTDTELPEWRERLCTAVEAPGVAAGTTQRRESRVRMGGIRRHSQAYREAIERYNKLLLSDLSVEFDMFDEGLELEMGDIITVSHPYGLTNKLMRITEDPRQRDPGRWQIRASEYDPAAYSDTIAQAPTYQDGNLPSGGVPVPVTGLSVTESTYQLQNGQFASRLDVSWDANTTTFVSGYDVTVKDGNTILWTGRTSATSIGTSPLKELVLYTVEVRAFTPLYVGEETATTYTIIGKTAIPDAPASLSGFEVGGEVRLSWPASTDVDAVRYEVRYGNTFDAWEQSNTLNIVDGLRLVTKDVPPGTWKFFVKTIDSIFQYSTGAATTEFLVTLDDGAFTAGQINPIDDVSALTFMHAANENRADNATTYYSDGNDSWASLFGGGNMTGITAPLASYQTPQGTSILDTEILDLAEDKTGTFQVQLPFTDFSGSATAQMGLRPDGGNYAFGNLSQQDTARYAKGRISSTGIFGVVLPDGTIRSDIIAREENGSGVSLASGATTITLENSYAAVRSISILPEGNTSLTAVYDNIVLGATTTFDVYIFNAAGTQVAVNFLYSWKGV